MNEQNFTTRLEATLKQGLATVPLVALDPTSARYRTASAKVGRRTPRRLAVAIAAIGLASFTGMVGAAASGTSPVTLVSAAIHRIVIVFEQINTPAQPVGGAPSPDPGSAAPGSQAPAMQQGSGDADRGSQPSESPAPAPTEEPTPAPTEEPTPAPTEPPLASQPEDALPSPDPAPLEGPAPTL